MEKIIKIAKGIDKALSVLWVVLIAASAIAICALLVVVVAAGTIAEAANQSKEALTITSGVLKLWVRDPALTTEDLRAFSIIVIAVIAAVLTVTLFTIRLFKNILSDMKEGRPFSQNMPARIRQIAYMVFVYAVVTPVIPLIPSYFMFKLFNIQQILSASPLVERVESSFNYSVNILAVFIGLVIMLLSLVFEYGFKLQCESDETL